MADITLSGGTRAKSAITNSLPVNILVSVDSHNDTIDESVEYIQLEDMAPSPTTIAVTDNIDTSLGNPTITLSGATFTHNGVTGDYDVRVGDSVTGTGIGVSARVSSVDSPSEITLSVNSLATGTITDLVVTPPTYDVNVLAIVKNYSVSGSILSLRTRIYRSDGSANIDSDGDGSDNSSYSDYGSALHDITTQINLDTFLTAQRNARAA